MGHIYTLRPLKESDAIRMLEWMRDEGITMYLRIGGANTQIEDVQKFIALAADESKQLHRAIVDEEGVYLGTVSLKSIDRNNKQAEYAIAMHPDGIGCGAATAGNKRILDMAFNELGLLRVYLNVRPENQRAIRFYEKNGWRRCTAVGKDKDHLKWYEIRKAFITEE